MSRIKFSKGEQLTQEPLLRSCGGVADAPGMGRWFVAITRPFHERSLRGCAAGQCGAWAGAQRKEPTGLWEAGSLPSHSPSLSVSLLAPLGPANPQQWVWYFDSQLGACFGQTSLTPSLDSPFSRHAHQPVPNPNLSPCHLCRVCPYPSSPRDLSSLRVRAWYAHPCVLSAALSRTWP